MAKREEKPKGLSSRILDAINREIQTAREQKPAESDYYAKSANPKTGGYAKCSYIKGDHVKVLPEDSLVEGLSIKVEPTLEDCDFDVGGDGYEKRDKA